VLILAGSATSCSGDPDNAPRRTQSEFLEDIRSGEVAKILVEGSQVEYELTDGRIYRAVIISRQPLRQILADAGIEPQDIPPITVWDPSWTHAPP
jgi:hypothetical protein